MNEFRCMICDSADTAIVTWGNTNTPTSVGDARENMVNSNLVEAWYMNNSYCEAEGRWRPLYETDVGDRTSSTTRVGRIWKKTHRSLRRGCRLTRLSSPR